MNSRIDLVDARAGTWVLLSAVVLSTAIIAVLGGSELQLVLLFAALSVSATMFWLESVRGALLAGYLLTLPVSIAKTLFVAGEGYWQTLAVAPSDLFLIPYVGLVMSDVLQSRRPVQRPVGFRAAMVFLSWTWLSALTAENSLGGAMAALALTKAVVVYLCLALDVRSPRRLRLALVAFTGGLMLQAPIAVSQWLIRIPSGIAGARSAEIGTQISVGDAAAFRPAGLMRHPNELADYPLFLLPLVLLLIVDNGRGSSRSVRWTALMVGGVGGMLLLITLSRGAWIAGFVSLLWTVVIAARRGVLGLRQLKTLGVAAVAGVLLVLALYPTALRRLTEDDQRSTQVRLAMFEQAGLIIRHHPIIGVGLGGYYRAAHETIPRSFALFSPEMRQGVTDNVVHNKYLLTLAENGIPGLLTTIAVYLVFFREWHRQRTWADHGLELLALGLTAGLVAQLAFYMFEHFYFGFRTDALWVVFGLLAVTYQLNNRGLSFQASDRTKGQS